MSSNLNEEVYVIQPTGLKQAPRSQSDRLSTFLTVNDFDRGHVETMLFGKSTKKNFIVAYVDNISFGTTDEASCKEFSKLMENEFEMSMIEELNFFLEIQIKGTLEGIYIHQTKYVKELLKKFNLDDSKATNTPMNPTCVQGKNEVSSKVEQKLYRGISCLMCAYVQDFNKIPEKLIYLLSRESLDI